MKIFKKSIVLGVIAAMAMMPMTVNAANNNWKQDEFIISTFHAVPGVPNGYTVQLLSKVKEANLNYVETTFSSQQTNILVLEICEQLGLKAIIQDYNMFGGYQDIEVPAKTDEEIAKSVENAMNTYGKYKSLAGYYIWDEPYQNQFELVRKTMDAFAAKDPDRLLFVGSQQSSSPSYHWEDGTFKAYIDDYASIVNPPLMMSNYSYFYHDVDNGVPLEQSNIWNDLAYLRKLALQKDIPFWYYVQLVGDPVQNILGNMTVDKVRFEVNNLLAYGVKGITYYNTHMALTDDYGRPTEIFDGVKQINKETLVLGNALFPMTSKLVYHTGEVRNDYGYADDISDSKLLKSATDGLVIGEFESEKGEDFVFITARTYDKPYQGKVQFSGKVRVDKMNKETGKYELVGMDIDSMDLDYIAGEGNLFRISEANAQIVEESEAISGSDASSATQDKENSTSNNGESSASDQSGRSFGIMTVIVSACIAVLLIAAGIGVFWYKKKGKKGVQ